MYLNGKTVVFGDHEQNALPSYSKYQFGDRRIVKQQID